MFVILRRKGLKACGRSILLGGLLAFQEGRAQPIPAEIIENLGSETFIEREMAQADLANWARKQPDKSISALHLQASKASDPEVRSRCLAALKDLVIEQNYQADGYLGIQMQEEPIAIPGDPKARRAIRVVMVLEGSAAKAGGLQVGDIIVGLNGKIWREAGMAAEFGKSIAKTKPGTWIALQMLSDGKTLEKKVMLGERPPAQVPPGNGNIENANKAAKEQFFQRWLDKHEADAR